MCEVFNGKLVEGRDMPIISALEYVREYLMRRIKTVNRIIDKSEGPLTPTATKILKGISDEAADYIASWNGADKYQVSGPWFDQCVVNVTQRTCTCRYWELTGIPCKHAVAVNWDMAQNNMNPGLIEEWVHPCYRLDTWRQMYSHTIGPINGPTMWPKCQIQTTILPPTYHPQPGRPNKKRKKSATEKMDMVKDGKLSRGMKTVTCDLCKQTGHNKRTCKGNKSKSSAAASQSATPTQSQAPSQSQTQGTATQAPSQTQGTATQACGKGKKTASEHTVKGKKKSLKRKSV